MSRNFLTSLNLNKNELLNAAIQSLSTPPANPVGGQIYFDTDTKQLTVWDGTAWISLAAGGNVSEAITAAINALTTDDIEEGLSNRYYTTTRAKTDAADLLTNATKTNISITGDETGLTITAENGVADSDTDDLAEGLTNLYYTNSRVKSVIDAAITNGTQTNITVTYDDVTNALSFNAENGIADSTTDDLTEGNVNLYFTDARAIAALIGGDGISINVLDGTISADLASGGGLGIVGGQLEVDRTTVDTWYDAAGSAAQALIDAQDYADSLTQGLHIKQSVRTATSADITLEDVQTISGVTLVAGDRVLVKNQAIGTENGIYVVVDGGAWTRAADADPVATELDPGSYTLVTEGDYAATGWVVTAYSGGATTWTQFSAANEYTAGTNIAIVGNEISFDGTLPVANGGTGATTASGARSNLGATTKYAANNPSLTAVSGAVTWVVTHNLNTTDVTVQVREVSSASLVEVDVAITDVDTVTLSWISEDVTANAYRVVVVG